MVLSIAVIVCSIESVSVSNAESAPSSSGISLDNQFKAVLSSMVLSKYTIVFNPSINKQLTAPGFGLKQIPNRNFEPTSAYLMVGPDEANRSLRIALLNIVRIFKKSLDTFGVSRIEVGLLNHFDGRSKPTVLDNRGKEPIDYDIRALIVYLDSANRLQEQKSSITGDAVSSQPHVNGNLYRADYDQRKENIA
jgi:hypothetical protein